MTYDTINDDKTIAGNGEGTLLAGRYHIVRQLGTGGMGSVWLAEDTQLDNKPFAIKMLPSILVSNKRAYRQLKDEALVAMKLTHPNIVTLRAFEENNGNPFLVMDYIDGQTLDDYLCERGTGNGERGNGLSEEETIRILRPIAAALDYAHGEGVVHRDVKPANVMIRKDGHPFILDFGIAREIQETMTRVTGKLSSGTLLYMSPEQLMGEKPTPAQDIYSFAAMVYECLKGEPPFSHGQIEFQIMNKIPEMLVGASVPLARSVMAGLAKKPEERPVTCAAVLRIDDSSRVEHVERVDGRARSPSGPQSGITRPPVGRDAPIAPPSVGSRVPQDRPAERSSSVSEGMAVPVNPPHQGGVLKVLVAVATIAFVVVGGWWYANRKQESARTAEQRAEKARNAEEAHRRVRSVDSVDGPPANYSGAWGNRFELKQTLDHDHVRPNDLVTATYTLTFNGYCPSNFYPDVEHITEDFKAYEPKEVERTDGSVVWTQILVPRTAQATNTALVSVHYYNLNTKRREVACAYPLKLTFVSAKTISSGNMNPLSMTAKGEEYNKVQLWEGGPYWADRNIGAEKPEDYGYYFWWGDTVGYKREGDAWVASDGSSSGFSFIPKNVPTCGKDIPSLQGEGWITAGNVLAPKHDAARMQWGGGWRMPTDKEIRDLNNKCDWTWTTMNGVRGCVVRGRGNYASASIFFPCAGNGYGTSLYHVGSCGYYWSSVPYSDNYRAWYLYFNSSYHYTLYNYRNSGQSVRPVQGFTK